MPHVEVPQAEFKLVILGDANCGKTSLITRFTQGYYRQQHQTNNSNRPNSPKSSSSIHHPIFVTKSIPVTSSNIPTKIHIWDVAGPNTTQANNNKGAHTAAKCYYSTSSAILLGYDVTSRSSYEGMRLWLNELRQSVQFYEVVVAIVALKTDLLHNPNHQQQQQEEVVPEYEVEQLAQALNVMYVPTSSKLDVNVTSLFQRVAEEVLERRRRGMNGLGVGVGGGMNERYHHHSSVNNDIMRPTSPKDLYGNDSNNKNNSSADIHHDHRDDTNTPNDMMMMNGNNNDNDFTSSSTPNSKKKKKKKIKRNRSSKTVESSTSSSTSNAAAEGCTPGAMITLATGACSENNVGGNLDHNMHGDDDEDITWKDGSSKKTGGRKDNNGENNDGSFFVMCGGDTWCGKTSDTID